MPAINRRVRYWKFHGRYVGPGWSAGKYQDSVISSVKPTDEFDKTAKQHDAAYYAVKHLGWHPNSLKRADEIFYKQNIGRGVKRTVAAIGVGFQGAMRKEQKVDHSFFPKKDSAIMGRGRSATRSVPPTPRKRAKSAQYMEIDRMGAHRPISYPGRSKSVPPAVKSVMLKSSTRRSTAGRAGPVGSKISPLKKVDKKHPSDLKNPRYAGITFTTESAGKITGNKCIYIGHAAWSWNQMDKAVGMAVIKFCLDKMEQSIDSIDSALAYGAAAGYRAWRDNDAIVIYFRVNSDPTTALNSKTFRYGTFDKTTATFSTIAQFGDCWKYWLDVVLANSITLEMVYLECAPAILGTSTTDNNVTFAWQRHWLHNAKIDVEISSVLKFQNRTIGSADNDEGDNVDNMPLVGRSYGGPGTGTHRHQMITPSSTNYPLIANRSTGVIATYGQNNEQNEPPDAKSFNNVKVMGKVGIAAGEVKISKIHFKHTFKLGTYFKEVIDEQASENTPLYPYSDKLGSYRFFALEKQIAFTEAAQAVRVAFEVQHQVAAKFVTGKAARAVPTGSAESTDTVITQA